MLIYVIDTLILNDSYLVQRALLTSKYGLSLSLLRVLIGTPKSIPVASRYKTYIN